MEDSQKVPSHIEKASNFIDDLLIMGHKEQVEAFQHVRGKLLDDRKRQDEAMRKEIESFNVDVKIQNEGSQIIAGGF